MEITGKVVKVLPLQSGQGRNGEWKKQEVILETQSQYPKKVCITLWGDKIEQYGIGEGELITASIDLESREFNGRWYTDVRAWKINKENGESERPESQISNGEDFMGDDTEDLPF